MWCNDKVHGLARPHEWLQHCAGLMMCASDIGILSSYFSNSVAVMTTFVSSSGHSVWLFHACVVIMSELELEQRTIIRFLGKPGKTGTEIWEMLVQFYGDNA
jgi:hypothetical protein